MRLNDNELTFSKEQILLTTPSGKTFRFRYRLDLSRQPRQYDLKLEFAGGPAGDERTKQLEALARRYQSSFPQGPQPVDFRATVGNGRFLGLAVSLLTLLAIVGNYLGRFVGPQALQVADGVLGNPTGTPQRAHLLLAALLLAGLGACAPLGGMQFHPQSFDVALQRFASLAFAKSSFGSPSAWVGDMLLLVPVAFLWTGVFAVDLPRRRARWAIAVQIVLLGAALRVLFEFFQFWFNPTNISQYDILPETIGLVLGAGLWLFTGQPLVDWTRSMTVSQRPMSKLDWALLCYLAAFIIYAVLPIEITVRGADLARKYRDGLVIMQPFSEPLWPLGVLVNTFLFIPVGVLTSRLWTTTVRPIRAGENAIAWGMALVALVELGQLLVVERFTSTTDLFSGTLGVVLGVLATSRWRRSSALDALLAPSSGYLRRVAPYLIVAAVYAGLVFVASCMPFRPIHDPDQLATRYTNIFQQPFAVMHHAALDQVLVQALWHMLFFVPLGMLLGRAVIAPSIPAPVRGVLLSLALLFVAAVALAIEVVQVYLPPHVPGMLDVVACTAGAALGIVGMTLFSLARARQPA